MKTKNMGFYQTLVSYGKMSVKRWVNKFSVIQFRKKKEEERTGTRKKSKSGFFMIMMCVLMMFSAFSMCYRLLNVYSYDLNKRFIDKEKPYILNEYVYNLLKKYVAFDSKESKIEITKLFDRIAFNKLKDKLKNTPSYSDFLKGKVKIKSDKSITRNLWKILNTKGISGFAYVKRKMDSFRTFPINLKILFKLLGIISIIAFIALFFMALANKNDNLGQVEWTMEWLFSFPVPTKSLFMIKVLEYTFFSPLQWFIYFPFHTIIFLLLDFVWWHAGLLGFLSTVYLSVLLSSFRLVCEIWIRLNLPRSSIKNIQALFTIVGMFFLLSVFFLSNSHTIPIFLIEIAENLPFSFLFCPITFPLRLLFGGMDILLLLCIIAIFVLIPAICLMIAKKMVSKGLLKSTGVFQGSRNIETTKVLSRKTIFRGVISKDLKHLWRDKNHMVQTLVVPLIIVLYNIFITPDLMQNIISSFNTIALLAFAIGGYTFVFGCFQVLNIEQQSLWLLFTFPEGIKKILTKKIIMWAFIGMGYPIIILVGGFVLIPFSLSMVLKTVIVITSLFLYAFLAGGMGILATNPMETEATKRINSGESMGYFLLLAVFGGSLYLNNILNILVMMFLIFVLVFATWQKVDDNIPFLLDPINDAPSKIDLKTGMISVFLFFFLQQVLFLCYLGTSWSSQQQVIASYFTSGLLVILGLLYSLYRNKVKDIFKKTGLRSELPKKIKRTHIKNAFFAGIGVSVLGVAYLKIIDVSGFFVKERNMFMENSGKNLSGSFFWLLVLYVFLAPVFEEFLFRGIVFQGFRRSTGLKVSIACSAIVFALVHNVVAIIPVFLLGVVTAYFFEKTNWLIPSIIIHMIYNAVMIFV